MKYVNGNILYLRDCIIVHQVNCLQTAGAGLAKQIRERYPFWYKDYQTRTPRFGGAYAVYSAAQNIYIASMYSQLSYGVHRIQTDYKAFESALKELAVMRERAVHITGERWPIYFPYKIGCGLAGGDWAIVSKLIEKHFPDDFIIRM